MNNFNELSEVINARRSVYPVSFTGDIIPNETIRSILDLANCAPSHKHTEPWRFHIVSGTKKKEFIDFAQKAYKDFTSPEKFKQSKYDKLAKKIIKSSHVIGIGCQHDESAGLPKWEEIAAASCAIQNIYLTITSLGFGGYWSSPKFVISKAREFFNLAEGEVCLGLFYLGVPNDNLPPKVEKQNIEEKVKWYV